ncbi:MAG: preprotein translocase subunit SecE [Bulleidia sp.]
MSENKDKKKKKAPKDHWFSFSGIRKETKRVRWPHWKSQGSSNPGILQNTGEVVIYTAFFALFFVACEFVITYLLKFIGIGA